MSQLDVARSRPYERSKFDYDLSRATVVENTLAELLTGAGTYRIEMKHDLQAWKTGRVFVETRRHRYGDGALEPSGLSITDADVYIQSLAQRADIYILDVELLRGYAADKPEYAGGDGQRALGVLIPLLDLRALYPRKLWAAMGEKVQQGY